MSIIGKPCRGIYVEGCAHAVGRCVVVALFVAFLAIPVSADILSLELRKDATSANFLRKHLTWKQLLVSTTPALSCIYMPPKAYMPVAASLLSESGAKEAERLGPIDYIEKAQAFGDCMIRFGRDRYGRVNSPLFSDSLTREAEPRILPYPRFADPEREDENPTMKTPFRRFDYNKVLNYPGDLGAEGPHKATVYGCDPYEDRELYYTLFDLSRVTGDPKYKAAAEKALNWWFANTQGRTGLYPWGEHLGWDLEYDCPTYLKGPSKHLYAACYHEIKYQMPFLDILARLRARSPGGLTPLERYALGIWKAHFWDKQKCYYDRHGDYYGEDDRKGCYNGFPAHVAAYMHVWTVAYLESENASFKTEMRDIFNKVADMMVSRTERYGFFPFTFKPELLGTPPKKSKQAEALAMRSRVLAGMLETAMPEVAAKLEKVALLHLGPKKADTPSARPEPAFRELKSLKSADYAAEIRRNVDYYRTYGDKAYLEVAQRYAGVANRLFMDKKCPLPKYSPKPLKTMSGQPFPDFYYKGAALMHAFVLLGEAERDVKKR